MIMTPITLPVKSISGLRNILHVLLNGGILLRYLLSVKGFVSGFGYNFVTIEPGRVAGAVLWRIFSGILWFGYLTVRGQCDILAFAVEVVAGMKAYT